MVAIHQEEFIQSHDGKSLLFQRWLPGNDQPPKGQVLVVHGYGEHGARYREIAHVFADHGLATFAVDLRGHGRSEGQRGYIQNFAHYLNDVDVALERLDQNLPTFVLGHSLGGLISLDYDGSRRPLIAWLIISNPFLALAMHVPAPKKKFAEVAANFVPRLALPNGIKPEFISRDKDICSRYTRDPLVLNSATAGGEHETQIAQERVRAHAQMTMPLLFLYSDADPIASPEASRELAQKLQSSDKTVQERPEELHEILNELNRAELHKDIAEWITQRL